MAWVHSHIKMGTVTLVSLKMAKWTAMEHFLIQMGKKLLVNGKKGNLYSGIFGNQPFVRSSLLINRLKFYSIMPGKITIITAAVFLSACSYFQKPEIQVSLNPWTGKTIYFVDLDDKYKRTASFNRVWSKLYKKKFRPYHKFQNKSYTILGTYEPQGQ